MLSNRVLGSYIIYVTYIKANESINLKYFSQFETQAAKLKRKYWWRNCKMWLILGVVAFVVLIIIIISVTTGKKSDDTPDEPGKFYHYNHNG